MPFGEGCRRDVGVERSDVPRTDSEDVGHGCDNARVIKAEKSRRSGGNDDVVVGLVSHLLVVKISAELGFVAGGVGVFAAVADADLLASSGEDGVEAEVHGSGALMCKSYPADGAHSLVCGAPLQTVTLPAWVALATV